MIHGTSNPTQRNETTEYDFLNFFFYYKLKSVDLISKILIKYT